MFSLTVRTCVVQFMSGNTATSFGVRQLAAAFSYPSPLPPVARTRRHVFYNHLLTKCKFHKSFILTFMQNAGGVGVSSTLQPRDRSLFPHFAFIPFVLILLRTLLRFFALTQNATRFFSIDSALFAKNTRGGVPPPQPLPEVPGRPHRGSFRLFGGSFYRMSNLSAVI